MDNPKKLATYGTQDEDKQNIVKTEAKIDTRNTYA
jgi:hypothetical protein